MNERLKKIRKTLGLTQQEFADVLKISRGNIAAYEVNKNNPSDAVITLICREFDVNENWPVKNHFSTGLLQLFQLLMLTIGKKLSGFIIN